MNAPDGFGREILLDVVETHIAIVTLNRPEKRNAVNSAMALALDYAVKRVEGDTEIRVAILTSSNNDVFCAGADLSEVAAGRGKTLTTPDGGFAGFVHSKRRKPWIAAIAGAALAGGCEMALACDMIVAAETSRFGLPEVKRGIFAGAGGVHRLPRALPRAVALEMIATGDPIEAARAHAFGMVNRVVPASDVREAALALANAIAVNAPISVVESLCIARDALENTDEAMRLRCTEVGARVLATEDAKEGPRAFVEKRAPVWRGK